MVLLCRFRAVICHYACTVLYSVTTDVQNVTVSTCECHKDGCTVLIRCIYLSGSDARGCVYTLVSGEEGVRNVTGTIERGDTAKEISLAHPYGQLVVYDLERDGTMGDIPAGRIDISSATNVDQCLTVPYSSKNCIK